MYIVDGQVDFITCAITGNRAAVSQLWIGEVLRKSSMAPNGNCRNENSSNNLKWILSIYGNCVVSSLCSTEEGSTSTLAAP